MPDIYIEGERRLNGELKIQGSKNAVLPIIAATVLVDGETVIKNCPDISDVRCSIKILEQLGAKCKFEDNCLVIDTTSLNDYLISEELMREMRSSSLFLGGILGRTGKTVISSPGGCELGPRPIDIHIKSMKLLGAEISQQNGYIVFTAENGLKAHNIILPFPSVGATENTIIGAVFAKGTTVIENCAKEPEIVELVRFLNNAGASIYGAGTDKITIEGVNKLNSTVFTVDFDRIVATTYITAAAITGGDIFLTDVDVKQLSAVISVYSELGCEFYCGENTIRVVVKDRLKSISTVKSQVYPGFPTDAGPLLISALSVANGTGIFVETIFENRYAFAYELKRLGAKIKTEGNVAVVHGQKHLYGAECISTDLRGGAALVVAGLGARGITKIGKTEYIKRGYENIVRDLAVLGADIKEI